MVPLNTRWSAAELAYAVDDCGPVLLLADDAHLELARELGEGRAAMTLLRTGSEAPATAGVGPEPTLEAVIAAADPAADADRGYEDLAAIFYTGGTTGRSKGVMLSHRNLVTNSLTAMVNMDIRSDSVHLHVAPMFHMAGGARLFSVTLAGGTHVVVPRFEPAAVLETMAREGVTITVMVPTMLARLVREPGLDRYDLSTLDLLSYGASPMPEALLAELLRALPGVRFLQSYGMTELSPVATVLPPQYHVFEGPLAGRARSAGLTFSGTGRFCAGVCDRPRGRAPCTASAGDDRSSSSNEGRVSEAEYNALSVRLELQADFLAGVWAHHAQRRFNMLERGDVEEALRAAAAIGDDAIQKRSRGYVVPESFTHGTSAQRTKWFRLGFETGDLSQGDTFSKAEP